MDLEWRIVGRCNIMVPHSSAWTSSQFRLIANQEPHMNRTARSTAVGWTAALALGAAAMVLLAPAAAGAQIFAFTKEDLRARELSIYGTPRDPQLKKEYDEFLKKRLEELRKKRGAAK
jgi:hypothetical protein